MAEGKWVGSSERLKSISEPSVPQCSWIKWKCFKILLTHLAFCLQIHPIIWEEIQQRRSRAFYQIVVRVGDDSQTGDQHDARICAPADKPVKVCTDFCWLPKLLSQNSWWLLLLHVVVYFNVIVLLHLSPVCRWCWLERVLITQTPFCIICIISHHTNTLPVSEL